MNNRRLHMAPRPCSTCPYARATPAGIWAPDEYRKLARYDRNPARPVPELATFHCHQENATTIPTVCRGWLATHPDSPAVRLAIATGRLTEEQRDAPCDVELYDTGREACAAGLAAIDNPSPRARRTMAKMVRRGVGRLDEREGN